MASSCARSRRRSSPSGPPTPAGLHATLLAKGAVLGFEELPVDQALDPATAWKVIKPEQLDLISYPYEWSFGQLKDAALLTLDLQLAALDAGMTLRDASAYNIQLRGTQPVLIDSLSFERHEAGRARGSPTGSSASTSWRPWR